MRILGKLLAGDVVVALARSDLPAAAIALLRMMRFGALVADSARTLGELASGLRVTQDALAAMLRLPAQELVEIRRGATAELPAAHRALGDYAVELGRTRALLSASLELNMLATMASTASSAMWRYEAFKVLRGAAWSGLGTERGARAEELLVTIAEGLSVAEDVKRAVVAALVRLRASR